MTYIGIVVLSMLGAAAEPDAFEDFFSRYAAKRDGIHVLEARFSQKNVVPGEEISTTLGTLVYARPRRIVLRTEDPETVTLVDGGEYYEYDAEFKQLVIMDLETEAAADIFFIAFDRDTAGLRENYEIHLLERRDDPRGREGILIRPKQREEVPPPFEEVRVFLREDNMLPYEIQIAYDADSHVYFYISDYTVNGTLAPERTQIEVAPGTKIIKHGELLEVAGAEGKRLPEPVVFDPAKAAANGEE